jgi:hypothetical protein
MKKSQKWLISLMIITPAIIVLTLFFIISGISIKEIPWWAIIGVSIVILVSPFTFLLSQRSAQRMQQGSTLQKRKKMFLTAFGFLITFFAIILIIIYYVNYEFFWVLLLFPICVLPFMFFEFLRLFFQRRKGL